MSLPQEPHAFFSTPVWPRSSFRGARSKRRTRSSSVSASSNEESDSDSESGDTDRRRHSSSSSSEDDLNPLYTPSIHLRGRHRKRQSALLSAHNLTAAPRAPYTLRTKHLAVITTLLHRCLLSHDWERARRAFGLLIRGKDIDIRRIWGVGLDILLRLGEEGRGNEGEMRHAIEYLERLALFFPYRPRLHSHHPSLVEDADDEGAVTNDENATEKGGKKRRKPGSAAAKKKQTKKKKERLPPYVSAVEFNPLLFSLLIESSKEVELERLADRGEEDEGNASRGLAEDTSPGKIKGRLEELMLTPPWDGMAVLKLLKGMVCLWMIDVEKQRMVAEGRRRESEYEEWEDRPGGSSEMDDERKERIEVLRIEAKEVFEAMKEKGEKLPDGIEWWLTHYDDEEEEDETEARGRMDDDDDRGDEEEDDEDVEMDE